jgi:hypothetical protein
MRGGGGLCGSAGVPRFRVVWVWRQWPAAVLIVDAIARRDIAGASMQCWFQVVEAVPHNRIVEAQVGDHLHACATCTGFLRSAQHAL